MNGNVATYSGHSFMPPTNKRNLDLRLDLNLMNLNNGSTPCTPNGKIKVYMNNITTSVTKARNSSNEWRRCKLDKQNCISLESVLETFNSSISEEQAWAICFSFIKCIQKLTKKDFKFKKNQKTTNNNLNEFDFQIYLHKDGYVHEKTIFQQLTNQLDELNNHDLNGIKNEQNKSTTNGLSNDKTESEDDLNENDLMNRIGIIKELNEQEVCDKI